MGIVRRVPIFVVKMEQPLLVAAIDLAQLTTVTHRLSILARKIILIGLILLNLLDLFNFTHRACHAAIMLLKKLLY